MNNDNTEGASPTGYRIGDLAVYVGTQEVRRGAEVITLPALSFRMLVVLAQAAPNVLTQEELIEQVWQGRVVSNETVTQRVKLLRQALGDDAQQPRYIGLVRPGGYRLLAAVEPLPDGPTDIVPARAGRRMLPTAILVLAVAATAALLFISSGPEKQRQAHALPLDVVALLPFTHDASDADLPHISASLNDELRDGLRRLGLKMVARRSSFAVGRTAGVVTDLAQQLGAGTIISGEISSKANQLTISVAIVDGTTGYERWRQRFMLTATRLPQTQLAITRAIAQALDVDVSELALAATSHDPAAYDLILLARHFEQDVRDALSVDLTTLDRAIELYRQAAQLDPNSALAHSRLAAALLFRGDLDAARAAIFTAQDLDPNLADVQYTLGLFYWRTGNDLGGPAFARAVELNPNHPEALAAHAKWIWHQQDFAAPGPWFERARDIDPLSLERYSDLGTFYAYQNARPQTLEIAQQVSQRFDTAESMEVIARLHELVGALDEAIAWAWRGRLAAPAARPDPSWQLAELYGRLGMHETADKLAPGPGISKLFWQRRYAELIDVAEEAIIERPDEAKIYYQLAFAYSTQDNHTAAVRLLRLAGLPERGYADSRRADAVEAMATYASALKAIGATAEAKTVAAWHRDRMQTALATRAEQSWWPNLYQACAFMNLDQPEHALQRLAHIADSHALAWEPLLRDAVCFRRLQTDPTFKRILEVQKTKKNALRARLPDTLKAFGLTPVP